MARGCDFTALGYSGRYGELLCLDAAGRLWAVDEDGRVAQRELPQRAARLCCRGCRVWVIGESDVYDLDREEDVYKRQVDDYTASYPKIRIGVYGVREFSASTALSLIHI